MTSEEPVVRASGISHVYVNLRGHRVQALSNVDVTVSRGELVHVAGPSGSGKTTLLAILGAMMPPTRGEVIIAGNALAEIGSARRADFRLRTIGFVFQQFRLVSWLTAAENILLPCQLAGHPSPTKALDELLELVGMAHRAGSYPQELSGGEKQRVALARALANDPPLLLADEPTGSLGLKNGNEMFELIRRAARDKGTAVVIASHMRSVAALADTTVHLRLEEDGTP